MNAKQREAVYAEVRKGCRKCGKPATLLIIWSFENTWALKSALEDGHPIITFITCDDHAEEARAQKPQAPPHVVVRITEEAIKPLVFQ